MDESITMTARDSTGAVISSFTSSATPEFFKGNLAVGLGAPVIASVEWKASNPIQNGVRIDNFAFHVAEPGANLRAHHIEETGGPYFTGDELCYAVQIFNAGPASATNVVSSFSVA